MHLPFLYELYKPIMNELSGNMFCTELKDLRWFQIFLLSSFLYYGVVYLAWNKPAEIIFVTILTAIVSQLVLSKIFKISLNSIKSAIITALGICILLNCSSIAIFIFATLVAISSKFFIRIKNKHIFNPSHIGIVAALLFTSQAWVSPGQWGSNMELLFFIGVGALFLIFKVGRVDIAFTFLGSILLLAFTYNILYLGWPMDFLTHKMLNGSLLIFSFFMITDPMTTPNDKKARRIWAVLLAVITFVLSGFMYLQTAPIWALLILIPFTPLFDKKWKAPKFEWEINKTKNINYNEK